MRETSVKAIPGILLRRLPALIAIPLAVTLLVGVYAFLFTADTYTAQAKLYVQTDEDARAATQLAKDYQQLILTHEVMTEAAALLGVPSLENLKVTVHAVPDTHVLDLRVTGIDPMQCMEAANALATVFVDYRNGMARVDSVSIASQATLPTTPSSPNRLGVTLAAGGITLLLCAVAVVVMDRRSTTLRSEADIERALGLPVLTCVEDYERELRDFLRRRSWDMPLLSCVPVETQEGLDMLAESLSIAATGRAIRTLAILSTKATEGRSSIAVMLASVLQAQGKRVLLIDMDFRTPLLGLYLGVRHREDLVDYVNGDCLPDQIIARTPIDGLDLVDSAHPHASVDSVAQTAAFRQFLAYAQAYYDIILIDTPPLSDCTDAASVAAAVDTTLLVVASGRVEAEEAEASVAALRAADAGILGVAANFVRRRTDTGVYDEEQAGEDGGA